MQDPRQALLGTLALLAATVATLFALDLGSDERDPAIAVPPSAGDEATALGSGELLALGTRLTPLISRRIEAIRDLEFKRIPEPQVSDVARLDRMAERRLQDPAMQRQLGLAEAELRLLGMLEPGRGLADLSGDINELVAGYYDPRTSEFFLVDDSASMGPGLAEVTIAHELTHALEDQRFGLPAPRGISDERVLAEGALSEGTATAAMFDYASRHLDPFALAAEATTLEASSAAELPRFAESELEFMYLEGAEFVAALRQAGTGWALVDYALERRPPASTEQVLHPEKYLLDERPLTVPPGAAPGPGWRQLDSGSLGEFGTREVLRAGEPGLGADAGAAGWGGDSYRLFARPGAGPTCAEECRSTHALAAAWRGDGERDAGELKRALHAYVEEGLGGEPRAGGVWRLEGGWAAVSLRKDRVGLGLGPERGAALRLARPVG